MCIRDSSDSVQKQIDQNQEKEMVKGIDFESQTKPMIVSSDDSLNLKDFLNTIQSSQFIQIHKSFIVNKQWIKNIFSDHVLLKNDETLQIGRAYKNHIQLL